MTDKSLKLAVAHISNESNERWRQQRIDKVHSLTCKLKEGNYLKQPENIKHILHIMHPLMGETYKLPESLPVATEAAVSSTKSSTTRTILIYELNDGTYHMLAPLSTVAVTRTGRTVKRTPIRSELKTPANARGIVVMKLKVSRAELGEEITNDIKCTQYGHISWHPTEFINAQLVKKTKQDS